MTMPSPLEPAGPAESEDELGPQLSLVGERAEDCRDQARAFDWQMRAAMDMLAQAWQGDRARQVMRSLDAVHESAMGRLGRFAHDLDEQGEELRRALHVARDRELVQPCHYGDDHDGERV